MAPKLKPGVAFWITCDRGFAVGLMTHHVDRIGHLIWLAEPFFDEVPTVEDVEASEAGVGRSSFRFGLVTSAVFYFCLLAHELAHALVARRRHIEVEGIVLWLLRGVSKLKGEAADELERGAWSLKTNLATSKPA